MSEQADIYEIIIRLPETSEIVHTGVYVQSSTPKQALQLAYAWTDIEKQGAR